jgi:hypothetical protein
MIGERCQPTLWPLSLQEERQMKLHLETLEKENQGLKDLVVRLSECVLRNVVDAKTSTDQRSRCWLS